MTSPDAKVSWTDNLTTTLMSLTDDELAAVLEFARDEQRSRAVASADVEALTEYGFSNMFNTRGTASPPAIVSGVLVCPGSLVPKSATTSESMFPCIDDHWCWEHPDVLHDEVRRIPDGKRDSLRTVTLLPAIDGMKVDAVASKKTRSGNKASRVTSYVVESGQLEVVATRTPPTTGGER